MKKWLCVQVANHKRVSKAIQDHEDKDWTLHTYQATATKDGVFHFLLFERNSDTEVDIV
jgi:hypothetical protein